MSILKCNSSPPPRRSNFKEYTLTHYGTDAGTDLVKKRGMARSSLAMNLYYADPKGAQQNLAELEKLGLDWKAEYQRAANSGYRLQEKGTQLPTEEQCNPDLLKQEPPTQ